MDRSHKFYDDDDSFDDDDDSDDNDDGVICNYEKEFYLDFRATTWPCGIMTRGLQYIW